MVFDLSMWFSYSQNFVYIVFWWRGEGGFLAFLKITFKLEHSFQLGLESVGEVKTLSDLHALNHLLQERSYLSGHSPSQTDLTFFRALREPPPRYLVHLWRWYSHIKSFSLQEQTNFPGKALSLQALTGGRKKVLIFIFNYNF